MDVRQQQNAVIPHLLVRLHLIAGLSNLIHIEIAIQEYHCHSQHRNQAAAGKLSPEIISRPPGLPGAFPMYRKPSVHPANQQRHKVRHQKQPRKMQNHHSPRRPQIQTGRPQARRSHKADDGRSLLLSHNAIEPQQPPDSKEHIDSHRCRQQHFHDIKQPHLPSPFFSLHEPKLQNKGTAYGKSLSPHTMPLSSTPLTQTTPASYRSMPISSENPSAHPQNRTVYPL